MRGSSTHEQILLNIASSIDLNLFACKFLYFEYKISVCGIFLSKFTDSVANYQSVEVIRICKWLSKHIDYHFILFPVKVDICSKHANSTFDFSSWSRLLFHQAMAFEIWFTNWTYLKVSLWDIYNFLFSCYQFGIRTWIWFVNEQDASSSLERS